MPRWTPYANKLGMSSLPSVDLSFSVLSPSPTLLLKTVQREGLKHHYPCSPSVCTQVVWCGHKIHLCFSTWHGYFCVTQCVATHVGCPKCRCSIFCKERLSRSDQEQPFSQHHEQSIRRGAAYPDAGVVKQPLPHENKQVPSQTVSAVDMHCWDMKWSKPVNTVPVCDKRNIKTPHPGRSHEGLGWQTPKSVVWGDRRDPFWARSAATGIPAGYQEMAKKSQFCFATW